MTELSIEARFIYGILFTRKNGDNIAWPGQVYLSETLGIGERSVRRYLEELKEAGLIEVHREGQGRTNRYSVTGQTGQTRAANLADQDRPLLADQDRPLLAALSKRTDIREQSEDITSEETNRPNAVRTESTPSKGIAEVIDIFVKAGYRIAFGNTTERAAAERIISAHGLEAARVAAETAVKANKVPYAPKITKPSLLEDKWQELRDWYMRAQAEHKRKAPSVAVIS